MGLNLHFAIVRKVVLSVWFRCEITLFVRRRLCRCELGATPVLLWWYATSTNDGFLITDQSTEPMAVVAANVAGIGCVCAY